MRSRRVPWMSVFGFPGAILSRCQLPRRCFIRAACGRFLPRRTAIASAFSQRSWERPPTRKPGSIRNFDPGACCCLAAISTPIAPSIRWNTRSTNCGITDENGYGHLFLGHSGAGKSTTAKLWKGRAGVHILSDDRIILRVRDGQIWMYGTPWHGDAGIASPDCARLSRIYLLEHGSCNEQQPLPPGLAAAELFARSFVPHHSAEGIRFTLDFLDRVAREIPCSVFRFVPDESAVEAICRAGV